MRRESFDARVAFRAAQIRGGAEALARSLGVPVSEVQAWMRSERPIPSREFGEILDAITEDTLTRLSIDNSAGGGSPSNDPQ